MASRCRRVGAYYYFLPFIPVGERMTGLNIISCTGLVVVCVWGGTVRPLRNDVSRLPVKSAKNSRWWSSVARLLASSITGRHGSRCRISGSSHGTGDHGDHSACNRSASGWTSRWWNRPFSEPHTSIRTDMLLSRLSGMLSTTQPANCCNMSPCSAHLLLSVHACARCR